MVATFCTVAIAGSDQKLPELGVFWLLHLTTSGDFVSRLSNALSSNELECIVVLHVRRGSRGGSFPTGFVGSFALKGLSAHSSLDGNIRIQEA